MWPGLWTTRAISTFDFLTLKWCCATNPYGLYLCNVWASCQMCKIAGCACSGSAGDVFPDFKGNRDPEVSDPDRHHGTCVTHMPWCMSGLLTCDGGENVPGNPGVCATLNFTYLVRGPLSENARSHAADTTKISNDRCDLHLWPNDLKSCIPQAYHAINVCCKFRENRVIETWLKHAVTDTQTDKRI